MIKRVAIVVLSVLTIIYLPYSVGQLIPHEYIIMGNEGLDKYEMWGIGFAAIIIVVGVVLGVGGLLYSVFLYIKGEKNDGATPDNS